MRLTICVPMNELFSVALPLKNQTNERESVCVCVRVCVCVGG